MPFYLSNWEAIPTPPCHDVLILPAAGDDVYILKGVVAYDVTSSPGFLNLLYLDYGTRVLTYDGTVLQTNTEIIGDVYGGEVQQYGGLHEVSGNVILANSSSSRGVNSGVY